MDGVLKKDEEEIDQFFKGILAAVDKGKFYSVTSTISISNTKAAIPQVSESDKDGMPSDHALFTKYSS
jgi:hypothetical protein